MKSTLLFGIAACFFLAGCVSSAEQPSVPLVGTDWTLIELNGKAVSANANLRAPTLKLDPATKRVSGQSGVNRYAGAYELDGAKLKFGSTLATRMAGPPEAMELEKDFLTALEKVSTWRIKSELELSDGKAVLMKFRAP